MYYKLDIVINFRVELVLQLHQQIQGGSLGTLPLPFVLINMNSLLLRSAIK